VIGNITVVDSDSEVIKRILNTEKVSIEDWVKNLDETALKNLRDDLVKHQNVGMSDTMIRAAYTHYPDGNELQALPFLK